MKEHDAYSILEKHIQDKRIFKIILNHSSTVKQIAVNIAQNINRAKIYPRKIDINLIKAASLLHDIGRVNCPPKTKKSILHGLEGEKIIDMEIQNLKSEVKKYDKKSTKTQKILADIAYLKKIGKVCRNHIGFGLTKGQIRKYKLPLPKANYLPRTIEQKIITYSDKLVENDRMRDINYVIERFGKWLGEEYKKKVVRVHRYLHKLMGDKKPIKVERKSFKILNVLFF